MSAELIGKFGDAIITVGGGFLASLYGFRVIGKKPGEDAKVDAWHQKFGKFLKWGGGFLVIFGVAKLLVGL